MYSEVVFFVVVVVCFWPIIITQAGPHLWHFHKQFIQGLVSFSLAMRSSPGCLRPLKNEDRKGLSKYFGQACKSQTEAETLCADYLKLKNCNDLLRDSKLTPFHLANSYLEQNPRVCWADIVRVLCELSKDRLAMEVAEEYDMNIKDCSEQI